MNTEIMQNVLKWAKVVLVILAVFLAAEALGSLKGLKATDPAYNSISVSGEGEMVAPPDVAMFSFSISADARSVSEAQGTVTSKMDAILEGLEAMGVEEKDIKTTDYSIWPKYKYEPLICTPTYCPPSRQVEDGYTVTHGVSIKIRKTEEAGEALALVGGLGATNLSGISFVVDDPDKILEEARALAIADAKEKAEALSKDLGVRLVRVVSFYDNTGGGVPYYGEAMGMGGDMVRDVKAPAPTIPMGENKIIVNVTVVYEIR